MVPRRTTSRGLRASRLLACWRAVSSRRLMGQKFSARRHGGAHSRTSEAHRDDRGVACATFADYPSQVPGLRVVREPSTGCCWKHKKRTKETQERLKTPPRRGRPWPRIRWRPCCRPPTSCGRRMTSTACSPSARPISATTRRAWPAAFGELHTISSSSDQAPYCTMAPAYGITGLVHSDPPRSCYLGSTACWRRRKRSSKPTASRCSCHMLDLSKEPGEENIELCASY